MPVTTRMPLKFGPETLTTVTCARVKLTVRGRDGREAEGWGETPLSVQWTWPSELSFAERHDAMVAFCKRLAAAWADADLWGHALEVGYRFQREILPALLADFNRDRPADARMPYLAALVCCSPFDIALHDAYRPAPRVPTYDTYNCRIPDPRSCRFLFGRRSRRGSISRKVSRRLSRAAAAADVAGVAPGRRLGPAR